jgi:holo-[acyl-carrier protein] synthase
MGLRIVTAAREDDVLRGIGTDIVEIRRIRELLDRRGGRFEEKVFTSEEVRYCRKMKDAAVHFAGRFAAKEAVMKALHTGWSAGVGWRQVEILSEGGPPRVRLSGRARQLARTEGSGRIHLSISHCDCHAVATAVLEDPMASGMKRRD